jgi:hypothetical protein
MGNPLQTLINHLYRYPRAGLKQFGRFGGYFNYRRMIRQSRFMAKTSADLAPVQSFEDGLAIYFLTGKRYLYQTLFCITSLVKHTTAKFRFIIVDDGSFDQQFIARISLQLPGATIVTSAMIQENLSKRLPEHLYPYLHHKRKVYAHIKKLTDIHTIPGDSWKLVLDSDMLFWDEPAEMIEWLKSPDKPLHMVDCGESYGYSRKLMEDLCGRAVRPLINVGAIGLNPGAIDWNDVERWTKTLEEKEGKTYYLEQALSAMLIGDQASEVLDAGKYIVNPDNNSSGILHHYVDLSKAIYFMEKWQLVQ